MKRFIKLFKMIVHLNNAESYLKKVLKQKTTSGNKKVVDSCIDEVKIVIKYFDNEGKLIDLLNTFRSGIFNEYLVGAYVHGSFGSGDDIEYSDFDGLVILKDNVLKSKKEKNKAAKCLIKTEKMMHRIDPLQHHGWFVVTEKDLDNWPQTYFPVELFEHTRSLFPDQGSNLTIKVDRENQDYMTPFIRLCESVSKKIEKRKYPKNMYVLKGLLSQFMLLPPLYVQARDKKGIFKKYSFDSAGKDFSQAEWRIMDDVSKIRQEWHYKINIFQRFVLLRSNPFMNRIKKIMPLKIPKDIQQKLTEDFYQRMTNLASSMREKLK